MSTHPNREKRKDKVDFSKLTPEEQQQYSREHMDPEDQKPTTEDIAREAKREMDLERAKWIR